VDCDPIRPARVLIDADLRILQSRGAIGDYLGLPTGKTSFDLLKMARGDLIMPMRTAIDKASKQGKSVRADNVILSHDAVGRKVNLEVIPLKNLKERHYLILFEQAPERRAGRAGNSPPSSGELGTTRVGGRKDEGRRLARLELDLRETREYLQSVQEQPSVPAAHLRAVASWTRQQSLSRHQHEPDKTFPVAVRT
jgi:two-component system CheB/CheR fusion protein